MAIRNFWFDANVDGRETDIGSGPRAKTGGMTLEVYQREKGTIEHILKIVCREEDGKLITQVYDGVSNKLYSHITNR